VFIFAFPVSNRGSFARFDAAIMKTGGIDDGVSMRIGR
jgi:hypothetical protein